MKRGVQHDLTKSNLTVWVGGRGRMGGSRWYFKTDAFGFAVRIMFFDADEGLGEGNLWRLGEGWGVDD